jgi:hypothetical protein
MNGERLDNVSEIVHLVGSIVRNFWDEVARNGETATSDGLRERFAGARDAVVAIHGRAVKDRVLDEVRKCTGLKIPHTGLRVGEKRIGFMADCDEGYIGWDSDADL